MIRFLKIIAAGAAVVSLSACVIVIREDDGDDDDFARRGPVELAPVAADEAVDESAEG